MAEQKRKRVLLVDDSKDLVDILTRRLSSWGYEPLTATTGEEGLKVADEQLPDLILLDSVLPKMKGREVCAQLKANPKTKAIPVIFLTALELADNIKASMVVGAEDYLVKPFEPDVLKGRIAVCLSRYDKTSPGGQS